ncbi:MAG: GHKL domain-containing protein [Bacteroidetes bacterium]|nr:GHKL domain-containing protein [Bacteroidota bacterium]
MEKKTFYASADRSSLDEILSEKELVSSQRLFTELFGSLTGISAIINHNRQIIFANIEFLELLGIKSIEPILGKRPGEVISCINAETGTSGCGTSEACRYCGAVNVILESIRNNTRTTREARILSDIDGKVVSWDLKITSSPIKMNDDVFYVLSLQDISHEKKLLAIERVFFHDLLNTAGGLNGLLTILKLGADDKEVNDLIIKSEAASQIILEEIMSYRQLRAAEDGDIQVKIEQVTSLDLLRSAISRISFHEVGQDKVIEIDDDSVNVSFETDRLLLQRVIINLLKNALEATEVNGVVRVDVKEMNNKLVFFVRNNGSIPEDVRLQIFQRSFSTKDRTRGLGTYSVKLVTENYLKGKVSFISNEAEGTIFKVELNKSWQEVPA